MFNNLAAKYPYLNPVKLDYKQRSHNVEWVAMTLIEKRDLFIILIFFQSIDFISYIIEDKSWRYYKLSNTIKFWSLLIQIVLVCLMSRNVKNLREIQANLQLMEQNAQQDHESIEENNKKMWSTKVYYFVLQFMVLINPLVNAVYYFEITLDRDKYKSDKEYAEKHAVFGMYFGLEIIIAIG